MWWDLLPDLGADLFVFFFYLHPIAGAYQIVLDFKGVLLSFWESTPFIKFIYLFQSYKAHGIIDITTEGHPIRHEEVFCMKGR